MIQDIYSKLYKINKQFTIEDVLDYLDRKLKMKINYIMKYTSKMDKINKQFAKIQMGPK